MIALPIGGWRSIGFVSFCHFGKTGAGDDDRMVNIIDIGVVEAVIANNDGAMASTFAAIF